jgi:peptide/nickel transport system substrate-binding protein
MLIAAAGFQLAWYQQSYRTEVPANGGTYAEGVLGPLDTLNPLFASSSAEQSVSSLVFSKLYDYDKTGHLTGDLALSTSIDSAGTLYTVKIRPDAYWQDGVKLTASDVVFTINLIKNSAVRSTITGWDNIKVTAVDDTTVTFGVSAVYASFAHALTFPILPEHILANVEPNSIRTDAFSNKPIGSGPFQVSFVQDVDLKTGHKIVHMEKNKNYYKGDSKLDVFQLDVFPDRDSILKALSVGEVNAASDLTASDTLQVNTDRYNINTSSIESGVYALLNTDRGSLKDVNIRKALQIGTDTESIRNQLPGGAPSLSLPFVNGQLSGDVPTVPAFNSNDAKKILTDDGWILDGATRKKDGVELKLKIVTTKDNDYERVLEAIAGQWRDLGIAIDTVVLNTGDNAQGLVQNTLQQRDYDVLLYQLAIGADPDVYAYWHSSQATSKGFNFSNYSNLISDDALTTARSRLEPGLRNAKYLTFARQWLLDVPAIGLYQSTLHYVSSKNVGTFDSSGTLVTPLDRYDDVRYWSVGTRTVFMTP